MDKESILNRIRKLANFANNGSATEAEVENYMRMARKLMNEHNITEHEVLASDEKARKSAYDSIVDECAATAAREFRNTDHNIAQVVSYICDVGHYWVKRLVGTGKPCPIFGAEKKRQVEEIHFYGLPVDVSMAKEFFAELRSSIRVLACMKCTEQSDRHFYCVGFTQRLKSRAHAFRDQMPADASSTGAIVLVKSALIEKYASLVLHIRVQKRSGSPGAGNNAWIKGWNDGKNYDLGVDNRLPGV